MHAHDANLLALGGEVLDSLFDAECIRAHYDDHQLCLWMSGVLEQTVVATSGGCKLLHLGFDDLGDGIVVLVQALCGLHELLSPNDDAALVRMCGVEGMFAELGNLVERN